MRETLMAYFQAEKSESLLFMGAGLVAIAVSAWLARTGNAFRTMGYPLVAIALIQLVVGGTVYFRTDGQVAALLAELARAPADFQRAELARMAVVMRSFGLYKLVELGVFAAGVALTYAFPARLGLYAAGIGCILQASFMLVFDLFAEQRGAVYLEAVRRLALS